MTNGEFQSKCAGIPCTIRWNLTVEDIEFDILDRCGRPAPWLEVKQTEKDWLHWNDVAAEQMDRWS
jgi:hypothetical protein